MSYDNIPTIAVSIEERVTTGKFEHVLVTAHVSKLPFNATENEIDVALGTVESTAAKLRDRIRGRVAAIRCESIPVTYENGAPVAFGGGEPARLVIDHEALAPANLKPNTLAEPAPDPLGFMTEQAWDAVATLLGEEGDKAFTLVQNAFECGCRDIADVLAYARETVERAEPFTLSADELIGEEYGESIPKPLVKLFLDKLESEPAPVAESIGANSPADVADAPIVDEDDVTAPVQEFVDILGVKVETPPKEWFAIPLTEAGDEGLAEDSAGQLTAVNTALTEAGHKGSDRHVAATVILRAFYHDDGRSAVGSTRDLTKAEAHVILSFFEQAGDGSLAALKTAMGSPTYKTLASAKKATALAPEAKKAGSKKNDGDPIEVEIAHEKSSWLVKRMDRRTHRVVVELPDMNPIEQILKWIDDNGYFTHQETNPKTGNPMPGTHPKLDLVEGGEADGPKEDIVTEDVSEGPSADTSGPKMGQPGGIPGWLWCPECDGTGVEANPFLEPGEDRDPCEVCGGAKMVRCPECQVDPGFNHDPFEKDPAKSRLGPCSVCCAPHTKDMGDMPATLPQTTEHDDIQASITLDASELVDDPAVTLQPDPQPMKLDADELALEQLPSDDCDCPLCGAPSLHHDALCAGCQALVELAEEGHPKIELSESQKRVIETIRELVEAGEGGVVFVQGKAGTGKSLTSREVMNMFRTVALAPTGLAAVNIGGQTCHRFFWFRPGPLTRKQSAMNEIGYDVLRRCQVLLLDEISMVRPDMLDAIDAKIRKTLKSKKPFGGLVVMLVGDMYQLEPVVGDEPYKMGDTEISEREWLAKRYASHFWFDALVFKPEAVAQKSLIEGDEEDTPTHAELKVIELVEIFRQNDPEMIEALNQVRVGDPAGLAFFNSRATATPPVDNPPVSLTMGNKKAHAINAARLEALPGETRVFKAIVEGDFKESEVPAELELKLKVGAQVMFTKNGMYGPTKTVMTADGVKTFPDPELCEFVSNGAIGRVVDLAGEYPLVELRDGRIVIGTLAEWEKIEYGFNVENDDIVENVVGKFIQIPLRLAWAITAHKSQGQTLESATLELEMSAFSHGQTYVLLSRVKSMDGLYLRRALKPSDLIVNKHVTKFVAGGESPKKALILDLTALA